ncbi:hypothetical protein [Rhizomonospora bruguierae]|uniref:hypothetical protein n=1 Tax=Rhizomonospora bruguierae TaxID=1581705 RepID=UPI001BCD8213|nr:hypothetical protein [Micromonospora sp. NBRC 107566]
MSTPADELERARAATANHASALRDLERFLAGLRGVPGPSEITEYATLQAREEEARADRLASCTAAGLGVDSVQ